MPNAKKSPDIAVVVIKPDDPTLLNIPIFMMEVIGSKTVIENEKLHTGYTEAMHSLCFRFFPVIQSWQHWHFCTTSNVNKLKTIENPVNLEANSLL